MTRPSANKIETVELARGIAALLVVIFHANIAAKEFNGPHFGFLSFAEHGVDFFFVLSGYIIYLAHGREIGSPGVTRTYLVKRFVRLMPILWVVVLGWTVIRLIFGAPVDIATVARSILLVPSLEPTMPLVVWTLRHEMVFYLAFALLLKWPRLGAGIFLAWGAGACVQLGLAAAGHPVTGLPSFFLSTYSLDFMIGIGLGIAHDRFRFAPGYGPLAAALVVLAAALTAGEHFDFGREGIADYVSVAATWWTLVLGLAFAAVLHGLIRAEPIITVPRAGLQLGAISYVLYLTHPITNSAAQRVAILLPDSLKAIGGGQLLLTFAGIVVAWFFHRQAEKPLTRALRTRLLAQPSSSASSLAIT